MTLSGITRVAVEVEGETRRSTVHQEGGRRCNEMEFTTSFIRIFCIVLAYTSPILITLVLVSTFLRVLLTGIIVAIGLHSVIHAFEKTSHLSNVNHL